MLFSVLNRKKIKNEIFEMSKRWQLERENLEKLRFWQISSKIAKIDTNPIIALKSVLDIIMTREDVFWKA